MGGSSIDDDWDLTSLSNADRTVVLFGKTGNGKSATGNSILGRKAFESDFRSSGVTSTSEKQSTMLKDGQVIHVIDTPGLFDPSFEPDFIGKEIVKCIEMGKDGIHAVLLVLSVRGRFSNEEVAAIHSLEVLFGPKIKDYMIVVFTGGDDLEDAEKTLDDYLCQRSESLQEILDICKNRCVLFNNKTKDAAVKADQTQKLLDLVETVLQLNGGVPYTDSIFKELQIGATKLRQQEENVSSQGYTKEEILEFKEQIQKSYEDQLQRITVMVESRLSETTKKLEQQLKAEQVAREKAVKEATAAQKKSNAEIRKLRENLEKAQRETEELRKAASSGKCAIL